MKKVLIVSSPFFNYQISVGKAFEALGYKVFIETYDDPIHPFKGLLKWQHKFATIEQKERLKAKSRIKYAKYIKTKFDEIRPNIVFTYNGIIFLPETLDYFRETAKVLLWMYDSVLRPDRVRCIDLYDHVDAYFCFEEKDVQYFKSIGRKTYFLPLACDTDVYYPIQGLKKDIDILFVATIYTSKKRINLLKRIVKEFPERNILIYGHYKPYYKNPIKWFFREKRSIYKNRNIPPGKVNQLLNRTKIALNIHHEQTTNGANQRVYEISGAGAYQICDANPYIESLFPNGEAGLYHNEKGNDGKNSRSIN